MLCYVSAPEFLLCVKFPDFVFFPCFCPVFPRKTINGIEENQRNNSSIVTALLIVYQVGHTLPHTLIAIIIMIMIVGRRT